MLRVTECLSEWPGEIPVMGHVADRAHGAELHLITAEAAGRKMLAPNGHHFMGSTVAGFMHNSVNPGDRRHLSWTEDLQSLRPSPGSGALMHGGEVESLNFHWAHCAQGRHHAGCGHTNIPGRSG